MLYAVVLVGFSSCAFVAGSGYRKLGMAIGLGMGLALLAGACFGIAVIVVAVIAMKGAEWSGIAAVFLGILGGVGAAVLVDVVQAVVRIGTPEAWDLIVDLSKRDGGKYRQPVTRTLEALGTRLPAD
jgi:hypothetical protein